MNTDSTDFTDIDIRPIVAKAQKRNKPGLRGLPWEEFREKMIRDAFARCNGNANAVARELGISRNMIGRYKHKYGFPVGPMPFTTKKKD